MPTPPPSQQFRNIGFHLTGGLFGDQSFAFVVPPEDLTVQEPSRLQVNQTLGGAWADSFDRGVSTIMLSGTNGWRGGAFMSGEDLFLSLRDTCFQGWHDARADAVAQGEDPNNVQLFFTDSLDSITALVAPRSFSLRRSKTSPLLMRYQIQLLVLDYADGPLSIFDEIISALSNPLRWLAAVTGLGGLVQQIQYYATIATSVWGAFATGITNFVYVGITLMSAIGTVAKSVQGSFGIIESAILNVGINYARAAANAFGIMSMDPTLKIGEVAPLQSLASLFNSAACSLTNGFDLIGAFPSFEAMMGASTCSSTGGGDPPNLFTRQNVTPLAYAVPSAPPLVEVTSDSATAITLLRTDPLILYQQQTDVSDLMRRAGNGVTVNV